MALVRIVWPVPSSSLALATTQLRVGSPEGVPPLDLGALRLEAERLGWEQSAAAVDSIDQELPQLLRFHEYSLAGSLRKRLWGSCYRHSALVSLAAGQLREAGHQVSVDVPWRIPWLDREGIDALDGASVSTAPWRAATRVWWELASGGKTKSAVDETGGIAFLAGSDRRFSYYEPLLDKLGPQRRTACFGVDESVDFADAQKSQLASLGVRLAEVKPSVHILELPREAHALVSILKETKQLAGLIGPDEAQVAIRFLLDRRTLGWRLESLFKQIRPKVLLVNAYEVVAPADLLQQIANRHGCAVVNSMNGTKVVSPGNGAVVFDTWFVHSEAQRSVLVEECGVESDQLRVVGHPRADAIVGYENQGSARGFLRDWSGFKIIAAFSQPAVLPGDYRDRFFDALRRLTEEEKEYAIAVKLHPRERQAELPSTFMETERLRLVPPDVELSDLIDDCDVAAVMYSSVAWEALMMSRPVVALNQTGIDGLIPGSNRSGWLQERAEYEGFKSAVAQAVRLPTSSRDLEEIVGPTDGLVVHRMATAIRALAESRAV